MPIVGGLDIHRKQITFDYLDTVHGGGAARPDRPGRPGAPAVLAGAVRLRGRRGVRAGGVHRLAVRCGGAGRPVAAHVAEPADTAFARGRKRHAKTNWTRSGWPG